MSPTISTNLERFTRLDPRVIVELDSTQEAVVRMQGRLSEAIDPKRVMEAPHASARKLVEANKMLFGNINEKTQLQNGRASTDRVGLTHVVLEQKHGDAVVLGAEISLHFRADGSLQMLQSSLVRHVDAPKDARLPAPQAQQIALRDAGPEAVILENLGANLVVASAEFMKLPSPAKSFYLCWQVFIDQPRKKQPGSWVYFIDAVDGKVLFRYSNLIAGTGKGYYSSSGPLNTELSGSEFVAVDDQISAAWATHPEIQTKDWGTGQLASDDNDNWAEPETSEQHERVEVDIHRYLGYALNYYYLHFGHDSWDHAGTDTIAFAHYSDPDNAYWHNPTHTIRVGDGKLANPGSQFNPFSAFDVIVHEFTHGVNHGFNVVQTYIDETGALNEAIADSFACFASLSYPTEDAQPWVNGEKVMTTTHPRSLADPCRDAGGVVHYDATNDTSKLNSAIQGYFPDHYSIRYQGPHDQYHDFGGVHINCPIVGHAIYLMVNGGTHRLSGIAVTGIGASPVEQMLYYTISTPGLLSNTSVFRDFRHAMLTSCQMLFPDNLDYLATVKMAFKAVGIGPDLYVRDLLGDTGQEPGATLSCMSPDIINRTSPADAALLTQIADINNASLCQNIELGQVNQVYFRIFNGGSTTSGGTFRLFLAPASSFANPVSWQEVGSYVFPPVAAGGFWTPAAATECIPVPVALIQGLGTGHFCFIGVIESVEDPAPDRMLIHNISDFYDFIRKSNNYAWRNCNIVDLVANVLQPVLAQGQFLIQGLGPRLMAVDFEIDTANLPRGATVEILLPKTKASYLRFTDIQRTVARPDRIQLGKVPVAVPVREQKLVERTASDFTVQPEAMLFTPGMLEKVDVAAMRAIKVDALRITRVTGIHLEGKDRLPVNFVVKFPAGNVARDAYLTFRQTLRGEVIGQMNYLFRIRPKR